MTDYIIVIPARYKSTRFPGKPLIDIFGKSMLQRVYEKCKKITNEKNIIIATDSHIISSHCKLKNMNFIITSNKCLTGTDRVAEVAKKIKKKFYINVQGDEPLVQPKDITKILIQAKKNPNQIYNGMCKILDKKDFFNYNIPKVITDKENKLLYMSRAPIPASKVKKFFKAYKQVCIYSFPRDLLIKFKKNKKTKNEKIEDIEILRFIDLGYSIKMINVSNSSVAVDTPKDLLKIKKILSNDFKRKFN